jgi:hypothetical protein
MGGVADKTAQAGIARQHPNAEQRTLNPRVRGSSPWRRTRRPGLWARSLSFRGLSGPRRDLGVRRPVGAAASPACSGIPVDCQRHQPHQPHASRL